MLQMHNFRCNTLVTNIARHSTEVTCRGTNQGCYYGRLLPAPGKRNILVGSPLLFFAKHFCRKGLYLSSVPPGVRIKTSFQASLSEKHLAAPIPFDWYLR
jgi:hypothetical protein